MTTTPHALWSIICRLAGVDSKAPGNLDAVHAALQGCVGRGTLQRIREGGNPTLKSMQRIAQQLGVEVSELLTSPNHVAEPRAAYGDSLLAHAVSQRQAMVSPSTLVWEDLVIEDIRGQFILAIVGDALAPNYLPGQSGIWEAGSTGKPGQPVLLADAAGAFYLRLYEPRPGGSWAGVSQRVGHPELTPEQHGVRVVARLRYVDLG